MNRINLHRELLENGFYDFYIWIKSPNGGVYCIKVFPKAFEGILLFHPKQNGDCFIGGNRDRILITHKEAFSLLEQNLNTKTICVSIQECGQKFFLTHFFSGIENQFIQLWEILEAHYFPNKIWKDKTEWNIQETEMDLFSHIHDTVFWKKKKRLLDELLHPV